MEDMPRVVRRNGFARPWIEGQPRQDGERCELSDVLVSQCACRKHVKPKEVPDGERPDAEEFDFR